METRNSELMGGGFTDTDNDTAPTAMTSDTNSSRRSHMDMRLNRGNHEPISNNGRAHRLRVLVGQ